MCSRRFFSTTAYGEIPTVVCRQARRPFRSRNSASRMPVSLVTTDTVKRTFSTLVSSANTPPPVVVRIGKPRILDPSKTASSLWVIVLWPVWDERTQLVLLHRLLVYQPVLLPGALLRQHLRGLSVPPGLHPDGSQLFGGESRHEK